MAFTLTALTDPLPFDDIIDVRAPSEFAEDHMPGAINLPVLSDAERAKVGTIYVQQNRFLARKIGAALVARNAADHLQGALADRDGGWKPLVYCWRGGQRSGSFASILSQVGWRVEVVDGGYRRYRRLVVDLLYHQTLALDLVLIDGGTGTGKTALLDHLGQAGAQVLDLEGMAEHRGSNFGGWARAQPSQKMFESRLAGALARLDPARPVFLEAESNAIGSVLIPPTLWSAMGQARVIRVSAQVAARARFLTTTYPDLTEDRARLRDRIESLRPYQPRDRIEAWLGQAAEGDFEGLAAGLIEHHYDPKYRRALNRAETAPLGEIALDDLQAPDLEAAAARILAMV